jgi:magnesium-transporting ATPase (P-type)
MLYNFLSQNFLHLILIFFIHNVWWWLKVNHTLKERRFSTADCNMTEWNTLCILSNVFSQKAWELIFFRIVYLMVLTLNFLQNQFIQTFFRFSQILFFFLKLYNCCHFQLAVFSVSVEQSSLSFKFTLLSSLFFTQYNSLSEQTFSDCTKLNFLNNYSDFMWYLCDRKKKLILLRQHHNCLWQIQSLTTDWLSCSDHN